MNDNFMAWLIANVPFYEVLKDQEINHLNELYDVLQKALKIEKDTLDMALDHNKSGVDYGTSFEKAMTRRANIQAQIKSYLEYLEQTYKSDDTTLGIKK